MVSMDNIMKSLYSGFPKKETDSSKDVEELISKKNVEIKIKEKEIGEINKKLKILSFTHQKNDKERKTQLTPILKTRHQKIIQLNNLRNARDLLQKSVNLLEISKLNQEVGNALKSVNNQVKKINIEQTIDESANTMQDFQENMDDVNELTNIFVTPDNVNEDELFNEFNEETKDLPNDNDLENLTVHREEIKFPDIPTKKLNVITNKTNNNNNNNHNASAILNDLGF
jgi:hypothetical protein